MKYSILSILIVSVFLVSSCSKDLSTDDKLDEIELREGKLMNKKECFELVFPIDAIAPDGTVISAEDEDEFYDQIKVWYENNPDSKEKPSLSYPIDIKVKGDKLITINNAEEMIKMKDFCVDKKGYGKEDCFEMDYPINFDMPDGSILSVDNEGDMWSSIKSWFADNPDVNEKPDLVYPVDIIYNGDKTVTVNNDEEMVQYKKECK